jgi:hypothetical protein
MPYQQPSGEDIIMHKRIKHGSREAYNEHRKHMMRSRLRIRDMGETGILLYKELHKAASEYNLTPEFLWERLLAGQQFQSIKMKSKV